MTLYGRGRGKIPVTIRGVTYESRAEAARSLGVSNTAILYAERDGRLDFVGTSGHRRPVTIGGVSYLSRRLAAKAVGVTAIELSHYVKVRDRLATLTHPSP